MNKSALIFIFIILVFTQCDLSFKRGNGDIDHVEFEVDDFQKIYVGGNYNLNLIPANECRVVIETDENLLGYINVENHEDALNINNVHKLKSSQGIYVAVYYREIDHIFSTGTSKITHEGILEAEEVDIELSGAGSIELGLNANIIQVEMSGAGIIKLEGNTDRLETHISGAGGLVANKLISRECDINLGGLGGADVYVTEKLEASITGIGGIQYSGNPKLIEKQITGLGKIERNKEFVQPEEEAM